MFERRRRLCSSSSSALLKRASGWRHALSRLGRCLVSFQHCCLILLLRCKQLTVPPAIVTVHALALHMGSNNGRKWVAKQQRKGRHTHAWGSTKQCGCVLCVQCSCLSGQQLIICCMSRLPAAAGCRMQLMSLRACAARRGALRWRATSTVILLSRWPSPPGHLSFSW